MLLLSLQTDKKDRSGNVPENFRGPNRLNLVMSPKNNKYSMQIIRRHIYYQVSYCD